MITKFNDADGTCEVEQLSPISLTIHKLTIKMTRSQFLLWHSGTELIQNALPHLTPDEREFLLTGITPEEWKATFGGESL